MLEIYPSYYKKFRCIADHCEDSCCAGWEIDIDDASYEAYMRVSGELGERLRASIKSYETEDDFDEAYEKHGFILTEDMRCPFLDDHNLCDLYKELGEEALCEVCTNTPRNILEYQAETADGDGIREIREISISASCPEAARLIYGLPEPMRFEDRETDEAADLEADEDEPLLGAFLKRVRDEAIAILQNRELGLQERIRQFLVHAEAVQETINAWESGEGELAQKAMVGETSMVQEPGLTEEGSAVTSSDCTPSCLPDAYEHFLIRMGTYSGLASIGPAWKKKIELLYGRFVEGDDGRELYQNISDNLIKYLTKENRLYEYEHLLVYYAFLLLNRSIDDYDYLGKAKLVVLSYYMNRDMDAGTFLRTGSFSKVDREENARIYAREVEHAEENLVDLAEEILFERAYDTEVLAGLQ